MEETDKKGEQPKAISGKGKGYISLICGVFAWMFAFMLVPPGFANIPPLLGAIFAVLGIDMHRRQMSGFSPRLEWLCASVTLCLSLL